MNVTEGLKISAEESIRVGKEEVGTSNFNQLYDELQKNQDKDQTRNILDIEQQKVRGRINLWQIIMIISTSIQNISDKIWTDYFISVNLYTYHHLCFA